MSDLGVHGPAPSAEDAGHPPALRRQLLRAMESWIDDVLGPEEPPAGLDPAQAGDSGSAAADPDRLDRRCDLYSLWSAMIAVSQEVKIQGRTFRAMNESLAPFGPAMAKLESDAAALRPALVELRRVIDEVRALGAERERDAARRAEERATTGVLDLLLDLRERLSRGRRQTLTPPSPRPPGPRWLDRLLGRRPDERPTASEVIDGLASGYQLALDRLDEALADRGLREIPCHGRPFDPRVMRAVEAADRQDVPDGTVLEVLRTGYLRHGETFRPAEVRVARRLKPESLEAPGAAMEDGTQ